MVWTLVFVLEMVQAMGQQSKMDMKYWNKADTLPLVLYLTGDGGFNNFSKELCSEIAKSGFTVVAINSRKYFWKKRTADEITKEFSEVLLKLIHGRQSDQFYLVGYSFGADVVPFIVNRLDISLSEYLKSIVLLEPSPTTDLKIHIADLLGRSNVKRNMDVAAEINHIAKVKTTIVLGRDGADFPAERVHGNHFLFEWLDGGHDFGKRPDLVAQKTVASF